MCVEDLAQYFPSVGKVVRKKSGKPFKSGNKTNTVSAVGVNPNTWKPAYFFTEDGSIVDAHICVVEE